MNRKQKQLLKQRQTTRQLMGIRRLTPHGVTVGSEELVFFLIYPENLSVLSLETIGQRVRSFTALLKANPDTELLALDSQETFQANREFYRMRLEEETNPALRELLRQDLSHLDSVQSAAATAREFVLIERLDEKSAADERGLRQREKSLSGYGISLRLAEEQDVKRLLSVYYRQEMLSEEAENVDGERAVFQRGQEKEAEKED